MLVRVLSVLVAIVFCFGGARANDSVAEVALGGLALVPNESISMDSEDLFISKDIVRVKYLFTNHAAQDVSVMVGFPLPDQAIRPDEESAMRDLKKELQFKTLVDGKPADLTVVEQAMLGIRDVSKAVLDAGLELSATDEDFTGEIAALPEGVRASLVADGILLSEGDEENPYYVPGWTLRTTVTRSQVFKAGASVLVEHSYVPLAGGSVGGNLDKQFRGEDWMKQHIAQYCIEDSWFKSFDAALATRATVAFPAPYSELWLGYVLKSGANWKGPIKDFRMVIDKGKPENLVSLCATDVTKISPTQFEVRKKDFEPKEDVNVMIVEWYEG